MAHTDISMIIGRLESLAKAATPGKRATANGYIYQRKVLRGPNDEYIASFSGLNWQNDVALAEALDPATILKLCAAVRELSEFAFDDTGKSAGEIQMTPMFDRGDCVNVWVHEGDWLAYKRARAALKAKARRPA